MNPDLFRVLIMGALLAPDDDASSGGGGSGGGAGADGKGGKGDGTKGDKGNGDDASAKAPKYSDDDLNGRLANERRKWEAKSKEASDASAAKIADLEKQIAALGKKKNDADDDGDARDAKKLAQQITKLEADVAAEKKRADDAVALNASTTSRVKRAAAADGLRTALSAAGAIENPKALDQAARLMLDDGDAEIVVDDLGRLKSIEIAVGDKRYTGAKALEEAAAAYLADNEHLRKASSGTGTKGPKGKAAGRKLSEMSTGDLLAAGLEEND